MLKMGSGIASSDMIGKISHGHGLGIASSDMKMRCQYKNVKNRFRYCKLRCDW